MKLINSILLCAALALTTIPARPAILDDLKAALANDAKLSVNTLRVAAATQDGETVTLNGTVFEIDTHSTATITSGNQRVNLSGGSTAAAVGTLTLGANAANTETVTVGGKVYTFQDTLTNVANNVKVGATASDSLDNLIAAINAGTGSGTLYAALTTINANVSAAAGAGDTMVVTAKVPGTVGNAIASTETLAGMSNAWGAATLASGVDPTAGETTTALTTAINAGTIAGFNLVAVRVGANEVLIYNRKDGSAFACTETLAGSNNAFASATMYGGSAAPSVLKTITQQERVPNATEVALGNAHFLFPYNPASATVRVRVTSTGVAKAWDGAVTITGNRVTLDNAGSTDWAATDTITLTTGN